MTVTDLKAYEYVLAVVRAGGISAAAEALGIAQPTLSRYIKKLEDDLGMPLFDRSTAPISLTAAGECFAETGRRLCDAARQMFKRLEQLRGAARTVIRIGISPSRAPYLMPGIAARFTRECPDVRLVMAEGTTAALNAMLRGGELDLLISLDEETDAAFERVPLFSETLLLAFPAAVGEGLSFEALLSRVPLIRIGHTLVLSRAMDALTAALGLPSPAFECGSVESALALVRAGIGAALLPSYTANQTGDSAAVRFAAVPDGIASVTETHCRRQVCLFYRREQFLSQAEQQLIACIRAQTAADNVLI